MHDLLVNVIYILDRSRGNETNNDDIYSKDDEQYDNAHSNLTLDVVLSLNGRRLIDKSTHHHIAGFYWSHDNERIIGVIAYFFCIALHKLHHFVIYQVAVFICLSRIHKDHIITTNYHDSAILVTRIILHLILQPLVTRCSLQPLIFENINYLVRFLLSCISDFL